jgi:hypothetical protein
MRSVEAGRQFSTTAIAKQREKSAGILVPDSNTYNPPFLRKFENPTLPAYEETETFEAAGPLDREIPKKACKTALERRGNDAFMTGEQFVTFTKAMAELVGGIRTVDTKHTLATLDTPFTNVTKITFEHSKYKDGAGENYARIAIDTSGKNGKQPQRIEYTYGHHQMGETFNGNQVEISRRPLTADEMKTPSKAHRDHQLEARKEELSVEDASVMGILSELYGGYVRSTEAPEIVIDDDVLASFAEQPAHAPSSFVEHNVFTPDSTNEEIDIFVDDPRLVGAR